jgi:hypothetical protein
MSRHWASLGPIAALIAAPAWAQDLAPFCKIHAGHAMGMKGGKTVPITCDAVHTMSDWFPVPALGAGYVQALQQLSRAKFTVFYNNPKDPSIRLVCSPNLQGYLCTFPLGPAELLVGGDGVVRAISKTISKDGPDYPAVMTKAAHELGLDTISDEAASLAMAIEAGAIKEGAAGHVDVTKTDRSYVYLFHL